MQGRYGNVRASARSHFIGPGFLRQQHAKRSYPNPVTSIAINSESSARKPAMKAMDHINHSKVANDDSEDERVDHAWKKWGVNINRATGEPVYDSDHGSEYDSEYASEYDSEHENEYSEDSFEDENMTAREKNLSLKTSRLLDKDMQPKKMKSMNKDAATSRRGDYDEVRDSARVSNAENHVDATNITDNMTAKENYLSFKAARLLDKDRHPKKLKSMNQDAATSRRDDYEEGRDNARVSNAENHMDATEKGKEQEKFHKQIQFDNPSSQWQQTIQKSNL